MPPKIALVQPSTKSIAADLLIVPVQPKGKGGPLAFPQALAELDDTFGGELLKYLEKQRFTGERNNTLLIPSLGRSVYSSVLVTGLGGEAELTGAQIAESIAIAVRQALSVRPQHVLVDARALADLDAQSGVYGSGALGAVALGARLGSYQFTKYYGEKQKKNVTLERVSVLGPKSASADFERGLSIAEGVCLARDLVNEPPNELYPETFAERARQIAKSKGLKATILDEKAMKAAGMNLHLAVGRGSRKSPRFVHLTFTPKNPKGSVAFVGKGITFDSGGLCIKPMQGMADMKSDMAGGAAVLGMMSVIADLAPSLTVHGIIGLAENMPDGDAYRPADVIFSLSGKGVEIINTDAEGRLVLADALTYAARLNPDFMVDAATLTGATLISLGPPYSAFFTGNEALAQAMTESAKRAGESFWRMPLIEELAAELKSDITDLQHTGQRYGGAISAALFLREFTEGRPWIHADVPGPTFRDRASGLHPKGGTGHAVLTFLELIHKHASEPIVAPSTASSEPHKSAPKKRGAPAAKSGKAGQRRPRA
ncbi:MAG: leucyl aminopeptidase [Sorangiineae bacterium NIC37A_2]|jgi:leucyl aminopeptidase|nr:MAG: leucyl aminopeptidase [Sorangiineae bacterium NIC37A_2]